MSETPIYSLLDSGRGRKLEAFGRVVLDRPCGIALWNKQKKTSLWDGAWGAFSRKEGKNWAFYQECPKEWVIEVAGIKFLLSPTDFGHLGIFPEQKIIWQWIQDYVGPKKNSPFKVLNLFAYTGGSSLACALSGAEVCHVDASPPTVDWAKKNAHLNGISKGIRFIVDDVLKFVEREIRRGNQYHAIIMDPPSFGRGTQGQVFKFEESLVPLLERCKQLLSPDAQFFALSAHTPGITGLCLEYLLRPCVSGFHCGQFTHGDMLLTGEGSSVPSGTFAIWSR